MKLNETQKKLKTRMLLRSN